MATYSDLSWNPNQAEFMAEIVVITMPTSVAESSPQIRGHEGRRKTRPGAKYPQIPGDKDHKVFVHNIEIYQGENAEDPGWHYIDAEGRCIPKDSPLYAPKADFSYTATENGGYKGFKMWDTRYSSEAKP